MGVDGNHYKSYCSGLSFGSDMNILFCLTFVFECHQYEQPSALEEPYGNIFRMINVHGRHHGQEEKSYLIVNPSLLYQLNIETSSTQFNHEDDLIWKS